ncbi:hypothetical protein YA0745_23540 [Pseudomonas synxantha]|uniref:Uncharacterized protein n=1 Tax=Pseudomonas synxantha TaxID=47883 RepID=A0ABS0UCK2_9PSED|nr:hypothetical protein [Pseudomonas synxantha]MBI6563313.1 hypothetical protein [Pseudomonas synxantha]MBI6582117.1 hypothetical protein [Pseudomonas synxantha]MBI6645900.1 hypothetical protein [Pseudomonas synxantha]
MPTENKVAPNIQLALDYSRSFADAKPDIGRTEKEHIKGLAGLLERTALENSGLQALLTAADERADVLETGLKWESDRNALLLASLTEAEDMLSVTSLEAGQRIDQLERALGGMLFGFDDGVGRDWSEDLLDFARRLTSAVEFKP